MLYDENELLIFKGTMRKGKRNGNGIEYLPDGTIGYKGPFYNNLKHGKNIFEKIPHKLGNLTFEGSKWRGVAYGLCKQYYWDKKLMYDFDFGELKTDKLLGTVSRIEGSIMMTYWPNQRLNY